MTSAQQPTATNGSSPCNTSELDTESIVATLVPEHERLRFLPKYFGARLMMRGEILVFGWMDKLCREYSGGMWDFFALTNGGFYMAPKRKVEFELSVDGNGYSGKMTNDAAGIVVTLFALSQLISAVHGSKECDSLVEHYHALRDFAATHPEAGEIYSAID